MIKCDKCRKKTPTGLGDKCHVLGIILQNGHAKRWHSKQCGEVVE